MNARTIEIRIAAFLVANLDDPPAEGSEELTAEEFIAAAAPFGVLGVIHAAPAVAQIQARVDEPGARPVASFYRCQGVLIIAIDPDTIETVLTETSKRVIRAFQQGQLTRESPGIVVHERTSAPLLPIAQAG